LPAGAEAKRSVGYKVEKGDKPAAGFELNSGRGLGEKDFLSSIASARQEAQTLFELSQELGSSLSLDETLSLVSVRLRKLIPYDSFVTFVLKNNMLVPEFVSGDNFRLGPRSMRTAPGCKPASCAQSERTGCLAPIT